MFAALSSAANAHRDTSAKDTRMDLFFVIFSFLLEATRLKLAITATVLAVAAGDSVDCAPAGRQCVCLAG
jgi:hypothetical protein